MCTVSTPHARRARQHRHARRFLFPLSFGHFAASPPHNIGAAQKHLRLLDPFSICGVIDTWLSFFFKEKKKKKTQKRHNPRRKRRQHPGLIKRRAALRSRENDRTLVTRLLSRKRGTHLVHRTHAETCGYTTALCRDDAYTAGAHDVTHSGARTAMIITITQLSARAAVSSTHTQPCRSYHAQQHTQARNLLS